MVKIELNSDGVKELLKSDAIRTELERRANEALSRLGAGYSTNTHMGPNRVNVEVTADTYQAKQENAQNNTILKAVEG